MNKPARLLVISPNWIGDAVMANPLLQLLRKQAPQAAIDVLAPSWVAPVWRAMPEVNEVIVAPFRHGALQLKERLACARELKARGYAAAYVLPNTLKFALIPWLAGIPRRVGYRGEMRYGLINVMHRDEHKPRPMVSFYAALADKPVDHAPLPSALPRPRLAIDPAQSARALSAAGLRAEQPLAVFAPGAEFGPAKRWPASYFAELAQLLRREQPGLQIALLGSAKDGPVCEEILASAPEVRNLAGATTLDDAIALIGAAQAMVSNDSGLLHVASALNRDIVALYGPTDPLHAPPFSDRSRSIWLGIECSPCRQRECPLGHHRCMRDISAAMVGQSLRALQAQTRSGGDSNKA